MNKKSGHWTNTGMAKFINDNLYNYDSNNEKSMNPFRWYHVQNGDDVSKYRETINGFPCRLILINDGNTPLNEGQNEPTPGNTKDMGIFNFNNDKDNVTTLGFNSDIFPNCASYEVTANSDTSAGAFISAENGLRPNLFSKGQFVYGTYADDLTKGVSVKMLNDNSFEVTTSSERRYFAGAVLSVPTEINKEYTLKVICNVSYGASYICLGTGNPNTGSWLKTVNTDTELGFTFTATTDITDICFYALESQITENNGCGLVTYKNVKIQETKEISEADELGYLKESFELRHPDEDDVAEDWGFMGVENNIDCYYFEEDLQSNILRTTLIKVDSVMPNVSVDTNATINIHKYDENGVWVASHSATFTYISISIAGDWSTLYINNTPYKKGKITLETSGVDPIKEPYRGGGLKALIDWVDNCTDEEFVADFEEHFHKDYTLRYFCLVTLVGAVDNLG